MILTVYTVGMTSTIQLIDNQEAVLAAKTWDSGRDLSDQLLGEIQHLVKNVAKNLEDITGIIIFSGPGSFTSLRIGHTVANALADSLHIPIAGCVGEDWITQGVAELRVSASKEPALPFYGADANITKPKH